MTSRDTSADTTLDNANMGTREDFEKWAAEEGRSIKRSNPDYAPKPYASAATNNALDGWEARQPEIDALNSDLMAEKALVRFYETAHRLEKDKSDALKAENERFHIRYRDELIVIAEIQADLSRLKAENNQLRKDAERYRWLRLATRTETNVVLNSERSGLKQNGDLDAAIDAAMKDFSTTTKEE